MKQIYAFLLALLLTLPIQAQRQMERLDRGVVAIPKGGGSVFIGWRLLATDPEGISFNIYSVPASGGSPTKLNTSPVTGGTNSIVTLNTGVSQNIYVTSIINGVEGAPSVAWLLAANGGVHRIVTDFSFQPIPGDPGGTNGFSMKFCWPADLDGDGEYDFVVDRLAYGATPEEGDDSNTSYLTPKVEAYKRDGTFLWRIEMGPNSKISTGHDDMVVAYDMNGDNHAEVLIKSSEGTRFADGTTITNSSGGVTDYRTLSTVAPHYISIVNGLTGIEISRIEMPNKAWRDKTGLYSGNYKNHNGHFGIAYFDGIHPSLVFEYANRNSDGSFNNFVTAWDFRAGQLVERFNWVNPETGIYNDFHQIRIADVDGDGMDEMIEGGFVLDHNGTPLFGTDLVHGDRHRTTDIDPDRPGLETFAIQQNNPTTLGMALYDAATGEMIKRWYMSGVGDVSRGEAIEFDPNSRGLEMFSTMGGIYNAKGKALSDHSAPFPFEGIWWDGDLLREVLGAADGAGGNPTLNKINPTSYGYDRISSLYNEKTPYYIRTEYGARPAFWGDILGDWREELIIQRSDKSGLCVISTWDASSYRLYCLMQNPGYRMQATTKAYYQSPLPDFYLASDMPAAPVAPLQRATISWKGSSSVWDKTSSVWASSATGNDTIYHEGTSVMFDLRSASSAVVLNENISPSKVWFVNPKGKDFVMGGTGTLNGPMELVKTLQGSVTLNGSHLYTGTTTISEGSLVINGSLESPVRLMARGTLSGSAELKGGLTLESGLNAEGGRIMPGNGCEAALLGSLTIQGNLTVPGRNAFDFDIVPGSAIINDFIVVQGTLNFQGLNTIMIHFSTPEPTPGTYTLIRSTGTLTATLANFKITGLDGIPKRLIIAGNEIRLQVDDSRAKGTVVWKGNANNVWDFENSNFLIGSTSSIFVPNDFVVFDETATQKTISLTETLPVEGMLFQATSNYRIEGSGGIAGSGGLTKNGTNMLTMATSDHTYTGKTILNGGILSIESLNFSGQPSSLGSAGTNPQNLQINNATLSITGQGATNRGLTITGNSTLDIPVSSAYTVISGVVTGSGRLIKTGPGQITLGGDNTFSGGVTLRAGTILLGSQQSNISALGTGGVILEGGTLRMFESNTTSFTGPSAWAIEVPEGASARLETPSRWDLTGPLTGSGMLTIMTPYVRTEFKGNWSAFSGRINVANDGDGGDFRVNNTNGYPLSHIYLLANSSFYFNQTASTSGTTLQLGALSGEAGASLRGANARTLTWSIGGKNIDAIYDGTIANGGGSVAIIKEGTGSWTLSGNNTYDGGTLLTGGRLLLKNTAGSATGTGALQTSASTTLSGTGSVNGAATIAGSLDPGDGAIGTLTFGSSITLQSTARYLVEVNKTGGTSSDKVTVTGTFTAAGTLAITKLSGNYSLSDQFTIIQAATIQGTFPTFEPSVPMSGYEWDDTQLYTSGVLKLKAAAMPAPVLSLTGNVLTVTGTDIASYRWYRDDVLISGAGSAGYTPTQTGTYTVEVTFSNTTTGTSNAVDFYITGIEENSQEIKLYPNPNNGIFFINLTGLSGKKTLSIENISGIVVFRSVEANDSGILEINISRQPAGIYLVYLLCGQQEKTWKIIKSH